VLSEVAQLRGWPKFRGGDLMCDSKIRGEVSVIKLQRL
jgi:hypothetical protein